MKREFTYELLAVVAVLTATPHASAQKYPERRTTRKGTELYRKGDFAGAEALYRSALELNPGLREATVNLGDALWRQEKAAEAADAFMVAATDSLACPEVISVASYNFGNASLAGQQIDAAIEAYKQSLRLNPGDMEAKFNLAYAQKLKRQQQDQDQNQNQDQDQNSGGGQNDQNQDQNKDQNKDRDGDGRNDSENGDGDRNGDGKEPPPGGQDRGGAKIDPRTAEQMLDAMQAAEDDTREKVNAKEVKAGARGGKNW